MAKKNKPKRFNRHRSFRVARRKAKQEERISGVGRTRKKREKKKPELENKAVEKKTTEKVVKKEKKKVVKKA